MQKCQKVIIKGGSIVLYQYNKLPENIDNLYLILKEEAGNYVDVTANFLSERKKNGNIMFM